jgi:hypothetical protein
MDMLRKHFNLLSFAILMLEGSFWGLLAWLPLSARLAELLPAIMLGSFAAVIVFVVGKMGASLWNMNPTISWRLFFATGFFGGFLSAILLDLHSRLVAARIYTGAKPIPYGILFKEKQRLGA